MESLNNTLIMSANDPKRTFTYNKIMKYLVLSIVLVVFQNALAGEALVDPIVVVHKSPTGEIFEDAPYTHMWYYRTEVKNNSDRDLKIVWFEAYVLGSDGYWYPGNVTGEILRGDNFAEWYTEGDQAPNGLIKAGETAVCDVNWSGNMESNEMTVKWSFIVVDDNGNDYFIEQVVDQEITKYIYSAE